METLRIAIPAWLARKNGLPQRADVEVDRATDKAIHVTEGHGTVDSPVMCLRCGRELTHDVSRAVGIGPVCCEKLGIPWSADVDPETLRETLRTETSFSDVWLPLSQVEVVEGSLSDLDGKTADSGSERPDPADTSEVYEGQRVRLEVTEWIAGEKGIPTEFHADIEHATGKAILCRFKDGAEEWMPRSQVLDVEILDEPGPGPDEPVQHGKSAGHGGKPFRPSIRQGSEVHDWGEFFGTKGESERPERREPGHEANDELPF